MVSDKFLNVLAKYGDELCPFAAVIKPVNHPATRPPVQQKGTQHAFKVPIVH